jgi:hypothetical protein
VSSGRKTGSRELVIKKRELNPCATIQQIGDEFGISRERVRQILASENLPTRHWVQRRFICNNCGMTFTRARNKSRIFCSAKCKKEYYHATLRCDACGQLYSIPYFLVQGCIRLGCQHFYCSASCSKRTIGKEFGFAAHPENTGTRFKGQPSK